MSDQHSYENWLSIALSLRRRELCKEARSYLEDAKALRRASDRHRRLGWHDSANGLRISAKSRAGLARMWCPKSTDEWAS